MHEHAAGPSIQRSRPAVHRWLGALMIGSLLLGGALGCRPSRTDGTRQNVGRQSAVARQDQAAAIVRAISTALNNLPAQVALDLQPPIPILDDAKSADGQEVLATCSMTPGVADGPDNYLAVPRGNAQFRTLKVQPGDLVRYFVRYTEEDPEHGIPQLTYLELPVRRLDSTNPQNALILEGGLNGPMPIPSRIEIWRFSDRRMNEIRRRLNRYIKRPQIGWEPSPDETALRLLLDRLNQWYRNVPAAVAAPQDAAAWRPEPLVEELPVELREASLLRAALSPSGQRTDLFGDNDPRQLQQAIWLRDISRWAKQGALSHVAVAQALFDWTIRNIQLDDEDSAGILQQPWQVLLHGHGTAQQRAWIFAELCRQQQLDVVMLAQAGEQPGERTWWLPALWSEGQLYLFDTRWGVPLPGREEGSVATLAELVAAPELLEKLQQADGQAYPAPDLSRLVAQVVASPLQLARRAALLEQELEGRDYVVLAANHRPVVAEYQSHPQLTQVELWPFPFQAVLREAALDRSQRQQAAVEFLPFAQRPRLWKARVLHFQGTKPVPARQRSDPLAEPDLGHDQAKALYLNPRLRPPRSSLQKMDPSKRGLYSRVKGSAGYWLGLLCFDVGDYEVAVHWLRDQTLETQPQGPWAPGARYNLARAYEALGRREEAIALLRADDSPQREGNRLRAQWLEQQLAESAVDE